MDEGLCSGNQASSPQARGVREAEKRLDGRHHEGVIHEEFVELKLEASKNLARGPTVVQ